MAEGAEPCSKKPRHGIVALAEGNGALSEMGHHVIVGDCILPDTAERSGLLAGIANTHGLAALPATVLPEDVQLWQAACVLGCEPPTDELATIIRVRNLDSFVLCTLALQPAQRHNKRSLCIVNNVSGNSYACVGACLRTPRRFEQAG